jgi:hypothetical protein
MTDQSPAPAPVLYSVRPGRNRKISDETRAAAFARRCAIASAKIAAEAPPSLAALFAAESASLTASADLAHARAIVSLARVKNLVAALVLS